MFFFFFSSRRRHTRWPRDWSSDVCSSDLLSGLVLGVGIVDQHVEPHVRRINAVGQDVEGDLHLEVVAGVQIGRASCRERVEITVVAGAFKKKSDTEAETMSEATDSTSRAI